MALTVMSKGKKRARDGTVVSGGDAFTKQMFLSFVASALSDAQNTDRYAELVAQFTPLLSNAAAPSKQLVCWIEAITHSAAQLDRIRHHALIDTLVSIPWTAMHAEFVQHYIAFVETLVTAKHEYLHPVLDRTVRSLRYHMAKADIPRRTIYERLHLLVKSLLNLIPTLPSTLAPIINRYFPVKRESREAHIVYIANILRILEYCPQLAHSVLSTVIVRAIKLDVEIQMDLEDLEDDDGNLDLAIFGFDTNTPFDALPTEDDDSDDDDDDLDNINLDDIGSDDDESSANEDELSFSKIPSDQLDPVLVEKVKEMASKLDAILRIVFEFTNKIYSFTPPSLRSGSSTPTLAQNDSSDSSISPIPLRFHHCTLKTLTPNVLLDHLTTIFDASLLPTFKTQSVQFIIFNYVSLSPSHTDDFLGILISRALYETAVPLVTRIAATAYMASFVSRAKTIEDDKVRLAVGLCATFIEDEWAAYQNSGKQSSDHASPLLYAVIQALLYIFCFRWKALQIVLPDGSSEWLPELKVLKEVVDSPLAPLQICAPAVSKQFERMASKTTFHSCTTSPKSTSKFHLVRTALEEANLDAHFPFDPFKLPLSKEFVTPYYRDWDGGGVEESDDEDESLEENGTDIPGAKMASELELGTSFGKMSVSHE